MKVTLYDPSLDDKEDVIVVENFDTWSADVTIAKLVAPLLIQLKETKHGAPNVDVEDVPDHLKPEPGVVTEDQTDSTYFQRWDWVLDEMIWLFSDYENLAFNTEKFFSELEMEDWERIEYDKTIVELGVVPPVRWFDAEGSKKQQERINNALRLFGKYFQALWD